MNPFKYEKIGPEILQSCKIKRNVASLLMQKFKNQRSFAYKKHTSAAAYMIQLIFCIVYKLFVCTKNIQKSFQLACCIGFV